MQILSANVSIDPNGNNMIIKKDGLTPAEIHVLRHIHGFKAVRDIQLVKTDKTRTSADERRRLTEIYGMKAVGAVFPSMAYPLPSEFIDEGDPADAHFEEEGGQVNKPTQKHVYGDDTFEEGDEGEENPAVENTFSRRGAVQQEEPAVKRKGNMSGLEKARAARAANIAAKKAAESQQ